MNVLQETENIDWRWHKVKHVIALLQIKSPLASSSRMEYIVKEWTSLYQNYLL